MFTIPDEINTALLYLTAVTLAGLVLWRPLKRKPGWRLVLRTVWEETEPAARFASRVGVLIALGLTLWWGIGIILTEPPADWGLGFAGGVVTAVVILALKEKRRGRTEPAEHS